MRRAGWVFVLGMPAVTAAFACNAILGLQPPPVPPDGGATGGAGTGGAPPPPTCAPPDADAGPDATVAPGTYLPFGPVTGNAWEWFDATQVDKSATGFYGGTFDGKRYVYFATRGTHVVRFDTAGSFTDPAAWSTFDVSKAPLGAPGGFSGAVFDGTYVYFVPAQLGGTSPAPSESKVARYDTRAPFDDAGADSGAWSSFDVAGPGGPTDAGGFFGGAFDGRYLYLVPHSDGTPQGRVVRFDTQGDAGPDDAGDDAGDAGQDDAGDAGQDDAGDAGDAGPNDAGDAGKPDAGTPDAGSAPEDPFPIAGNWASFDVSTVNPLALGFAGAVYDGTSLYLVPQANGAFDGGYHSGASPIVARLDNLKTGFTTPSAWTTYDLSNVSGSAYNFTGGAFDGRYLYLAPHSANVVARYDTRVGSITTASAWSSYDLNHVVQVSGTSASYDGALFDGRYVYFLPSSQPTPATPFTIVVRYDTLSPFTADCAWSTVDLSGTLVDGKNPGTRGGAVFDGQYVYFLPLSTGIFGRFHARFPPSMPNLHPPVPYYGSFW